MCQDDLTWYLSSLVDNATVWAVTAGWGQAAVTAGWGRATEPAGWLAFFVSLKHECDRPIPQASDANS